MTRTLITFLGALGALGALFALCLEAPRQPAASFIVQASTPGEAARAVAAVGGEITHELAIVRSVAARLTEGQRRELAQRPEVRRIHADATARVAGTPQPDTVYPTLIGADRLHNQGIDGRGVTVAVLDTGTWETYYLTRGTAYRGWRIVANYDAIADSEGYGSNDGNGHGTHVASVVASSGKTRKGKLYNGVAPGVDLVVVKAFDDAGQGTYADVIRGIEWVVANRDAYGVRVLNLSFSAPPRSYYWDDPLAQAVMAAWEAGIVVVASAGNTGPDPQTIGVPGNVPYVVTVGAMSDAVTPGTPGDDFLASFSAAGPTFEGFVKPDLVAPGGHMRGIMRNDHRIAVQHPDFYETSNTFVMSGTSQSAAVVSGVAALVLQSEPGLTPDDVKCRLMASARPAVAQGRLAYSVFQQGAGRVDAYAAVHGNAAGCANRGLDVSSDLAGLEHYGGRANLAADGSYYLMGLEGDGYTWSDGYIWSGGYLWSDGYVWSDGLLWADATLWSDGYLWSDALLWSDAMLWSDGLLWSDATGTPAAINTWVEQE